MSDQPDLEALAAGAIRDCPLTTDDLIVVMWDGDETHADRKRARAVLAAVLPAHEQMVREKVAAEIEAEGPWCSGSQGLRHGGCRCYDYAQTIARGYGPSTPEELEYRGQG